MKDNTNLKNQFFESNRELTDLFVELYKDYESLQNNHEVLEKTNEVLKQENFDLLNKKDKAILEINSKFGIVNLAKLNGEAVFDAINHFNKSCPYCKTDLYAGHIRNNYEIDHFIPIAKGGQDVPWNLLPICRNCNRKKKDKFPFDYLDESTYKECSLYLESVLLKVTNSHEDRLQRDEIIYNSLLSLAAKKLTVEKFIAELYTLFNIQSTSENDESENLELFDLLSRERINSCTITSYFSLSNVMTFQEIKERKIQRRVIKKVLIKLYGEPDKNQRFYKARRYL